MTRPRLVGIQCARGKLNLARSPVPPQFRSRCLNKPDSFVAGSSSSFPFLFPLAHVCFAPRSARKRWAQRRTQSPKKGVQTQRPERSEPCRKGGRGTGNIGTIPGFSHLQPNLSFFPYLDPRSYFTLSFGLPYDDDAFPLSLLLALHFFLLQSPESGFFLAPGIKEMFPYQ